MVDKHKSVEDIIRSEGPMLSSDIIAIYKKQGVSPSAARQRVRRRNSLVKSLNGLPFPKNTNFLYVEGEFGSPKFFEALVKALLESSPAYACAISGLEARGGICLKTDWDIISAAPVLQQGHLASQEILKRLMAVKLIKELNVAGIGECIVFDDRFGSLNFAEFRSRLALEHIVIDMVKNWAIRMCFTSNDTVQVRNTTKQPKFSTHNFDIVGPSYLYALKKRGSTGVQNGFFVADVIWNNELSLAQVSGFLKKITNLSYLKKLGSFQPMLVSNGFTKDALMKCRATGVITVTPDTLLGRDVAQALSQLLETLNKAAEIAIGNPEKIELLFDRLSAIDGISGNLQGALFEMLAGHILKDLYAGSIDIGVIVTDHETSRKADIDLRHVGGDAVTCIECKGYPSHKKVTIEEVKYWLEKQVPIFYGSQKYEQRFADKRKVYEIWTMGYYEDDALEYLNERKDVIKKYDIFWRDNEYVLSQSKKLETKTVYNTLRKYYLEHATDKKLGLV
ncbi:MAG: hypothetical protein CBB87_00105 [Micavibrio sp. TMED27]|nr:hypothetical protein [Micavibrio sp.]OUT93219.1 MAG: hypothetical protein CBB87_00105 [Micavibrio sp. TMED27]|tara:strand:- start:305 stop:1825 length:1521 start_codon:yes stop_codon:yes gene_type:complete